MDRHAVAQPQRQAKLHITTQPCHGNWQGTGKVLLFYPLSIMDVRNPATNKASGLAVSLCVHMHLFDLATTYTRVVLFAGL